MIAGRSGRGKTKEWNSKGHILTITIISLFILAQKVYLQ